MTKSRKALSTLAVVGVVGSTAGASVFSAFSSTTTNPGNSFSAGSVSIGDDDAGAAMYSLTNQKPGVITSRWIKVTYSGSLAAAVKLYTPSTVVAGAQYVNPTITPGTQATSTFPDCSGFVAAAGGAVFNGTLQAFAATHNSFGTGLALNDQGGSAEWNSGDAVVYMFDVALQDVNAAQDASSGTHDFVWQSQNL